MTGFFTGPQISWGAGALEQLSGLGAQRAFVVVDPTLARWGVQRRAVEELEKSDTVVEICSDVTIEPTTGSVDAAAPKVRSFRPDWIVAVGGGSTIDFAKALWVRYAHPERAWREVTPIAELGLRAKARFAAVPTTSGSGSEATWVAHLRDEDRRLVELASRELTPDWALLDPALTESMPPAITAETAGDLLAHALEAVVSEWSNPFSDAVALRAVGLAATALPEVMRHPQSRDARERLLCASTLAGLASANAQLGVAHALAHALGGVFMLPHARLASTLLPFAMEFNYPVAREKFTTIGTVLGPAVAQNRSSLPERLRAIWDRAGLPRTLPLAGIPSDELKAHRAEIIERARASTAVVANPRIPTPEEFGRLLDAATAGSAVDF